MAYAYLSMGAYEQAEKNFNAVVSFCQSSGYEFIGTTAEALSCVIEVAKGNISAGVTALNRHALKFIAQGKNYHAQTSHYLLGSIFLNMVLRKRGLNFSTLVRNLPFFLRKLPRAAKHAEHHFKAAIRIADQINAKGIKGQASLDLGRLYQSKKRYNLAVPLITESIALFKQLGADRHLERAQAVLDGMDRIR
jgi:tetratricopeptide (TPR) repeat protein